MMAFRQYNSNLLTT